MFPLRKMVVWCQFYKIPTRIENMFLWESELGKEIKCKQWLIFSSKGKQLLILSIIQAIYICKTRNCKPEYMLKIFFVKSINDRDIRYWLHQEYCIPVGESFQKMAFHILYYSISKKKKKKTHTHTHTHTYTHAHKAKYNDNLFGFF